MSTAVQGRLRQVTRLAPTNSSARITSVVDLGRDNLAEVLYETFPGSGRLNTALRNRWDLRTGPDASVDLDADSIPDECQRAVAIDFDGDRKSDFSIARPIIGGWYWFIDDAAKSIYQFGLFNRQNQDALFAGDFNGDGKIEPGIIRAIGQFLYWYSRNEDGTATVTQWGLNSDFALTGHFDLDRSLDRAVVRNVLGGKRWFIKGSNSTIVSDRLWGLSGDVPFAGDLDGDGIDEMIVARREGLYTVWYATTIDGNALTPRLFGLASDELLPPFDYDGDGVDDFIVARRQTHEIVFFVEQSSNPAQPLSLPFGFSQDLAIVGSFNTPGKGTFAVFRGNEQSFFANYFVNSPRDTPRSGFGKFFGFWSDYVIGSDGTGKR